MIFGDARNFWIVSGSKLLPFFQVRRSVSVVFGLKFTETEKIPCGARSGCEFGQLLERRNRVGVAVGVVLQRAEEEPAFLPVGADGNGAAIVFDGHLGAAGVASRGRGLSGDGEVGLAILRRGQCGWLRESRCDETPN